MFVCLFCASLGQPWSASPLTHECLCFHILLRTIVHCDHLLIEEISWITAVSKQKIRLFFFFPFSSSVAVLRLSFYTGNNHFVLFFYCHFSSKTSNFRVLKRFLVSSSWPFRVFNGLTSNRAFHLPWMELLLESICLHNWDHRCVQPFKQWFLFSRPNLPRCYFESDQNY